MNIKLRSTLLISLIAFFVSQQCLADDVIVGSKTNATSAAVTISNSDIQQLIISTIPDLTGTTITSSQATISASEGANYLIFQVTTSSSDTMSIAIRLTVSSAQLSFQTHTGKDVHICKGYGSCTSCTFMFNDSKNITGCFIKKFKKGEALNYGGCNHTLTIAQ